MKNKIYKYYTIAAGIAIIFLAQGCGKLENFGNINNNPLGVTTPITGALITDAESQLGEIVCGLGAGGTKCGLYCQYFSETQYLDASKYALQNLEFSDPYATSLADLQTVINKNSDPLTSGTVSTSGSNANQIAIAKILKSYIMWTVTDRWGDVPYSQALTGAANTNPAYDKQSDIYAKLLVELKSAINGFDAGLTVKGDIIYQGNPVKWKKVANSLRMLIALRMSKRYPTPSEPAAAEFASAFSDPNGYIETNDDNFTLSYPGGSYNNVWYNTYQARTDYAYCKTFADALNKMNDTRTAAFANGNVPVAYGGGTPPNGYSLVLADSKRTTSSPIYIVTAAATLLAIAEAAELKWIPTTANTAQTYYNNGVTQSFIQWGLVIPPTYLTGSFANYQAGIGAGTIGQNPYNTISDTANATTTTKLQRIALQRWIALYPDGVQGWCEWRRTGFPNISPTKFASNSPKFEIPRRFAYGQREYNLNPANLQEAVNRLPGGDNQLSHVWWDQ